MQNKFFPNDNNNSSSLSNKVSMKRSLQKTRSKTSYDEVIEMPLLSEENQMRVDEDEEGNDEDECEDSPSTLPSNKFKYVLAVNNSKLSRKPYYK
jgi:hypothetical protein